jgi:hypothetical protein
LVYWVLSQLFPELQQQFCPCFLTVWDFTTELSATSRKLWG